MPHCRITRRILHPPRLSREQAGLAGWQAGPDAMSGPRPLVKTDVSQRVRVRVQLRNKPAGPAQPIVHCHLPLLSSPYPYPTTLAPQCRADGTHPTHPNAGTDPHWPSLPRIHAQVGFVGKDPGRSCRTAHGPLPYTHAVFALFLGHLLYKYVCLARPHSFSPPAWLSPTYLSSKIQLPHSFRPAFSSSSSCLKPRLEHTIPFWTKTTARLLRTDTDTLRPPQSIVRFIVRYV